MTRRLLDSQLLNAQFRFHDPEYSIDRLNRQRPDSAADPTIVGYYDERPHGGRAENPDAAYVWCCHCQRQTHWEGFVVQDNTGETYIIGSQCGRQHYGGEFVLVEKRFNEERIRQAALKRWLRVTAKLDAIEVALSDLANDPYLLLHDNKQQEIQKASPSAFNRLRASVQRGALEYHERVRDLAAEEERRVRYQRAVEAFRALPAKERKKREWMGLAPEEENDPLYRTIHHNLGHVVGTSLLGLSDVRKATLEVRNHLNAVSAADKRGTDNIDTRSLLQLRKSLVEAVNALRQNVIATNFCELFFESDNLDRIETWSRPFRDFQYRPDNNVLIVSDRDRGEKSIAPIPVGNIRALKVLESFDVTIMEDDLEADGLVTPENENDPLSRRTVA